SGGGLRQRSPGCAVRPHGSSRQRAGRLHRWTADDPGESRDLEAAPHQSRLPRSTREPDLGARHPVAESRRIAPVYAPRAGIEPELGDVEVIVADDRLHLFHLTPPNNDAVAHAVSDDGLSWRELPVALRTGPPGSCDDDQIWTMSVTERA